MTLTSIDDPFLSQLLHLWAKFNSFTSFGYYQGFMEFLFSAFQPIIVIFVFDGLSVLNSVSEGFFKLAPVYF